MLSFISLDLAPSSLRRLHLYVTATHSFFTATFANVGAIFQARLRWWSGEEISSQVSPRVRRGWVEASCGRRFGDPFLAGPRLGRGTIAQASVQTQSIVDDLHLFEHRRPRPGAGAVAGEVNVLDLERAEGAFHERVVETIAPTAHGIGNAVPLQHRPAELGGIFGRFK